jgi:hypothetical protein
MKLYEIIKNSFGIFSVADDAIVLIIEVTISKILVGRIKYYISVIITPRFLNLSINLS